MLSRFKENVLLQVLTLVLFGPACQASSLGLTVHVVPLDNDGGKMVGTGFFPRNLFCHSIFKSKRLIWVSETVSLFWRLDLLIKQHTSHLTDLSGSGSLTEEETQYYYLLPSMWHEAKFIIVSLYMILWSKYRSVLLPHKKKTLTFITWELYCMNMINCTL